jgi:hypothetical protein
MTFMLHPRRAGDPTGAGVLQGELAGLGGDVVGADQAQQADGRSRKRGHESGTFAGAHLGAVLLEGDIADIVQAVFDRPVTAVEREQASGIGPLLGEAGDEGRPFPWRSCRPSRSSRVYARPHQSSGSSFQTGFAERGFLFQLFFSLINDDECEE